MEELNFHKRGQLVTTNGACEELVYLAEGRGAAVEDECGGLSFLCVAYGARKMGSFLKPLATFAELKLE